ncbi:MAG: UDP-3-O-[3-hydroxymyristoyl] N-acetylglucosamine deacetylase [Bacteroidales bacterium]|nr:UDP-3-O-[3-hydroxymyristoyl] N-acetylglucosamine deacetylase [Bacteroidales bacterium]
MNQQTIKKPYIFEGKGLHSGKKVKMTLLPAPENFGIQFSRTDLPGSSLIEAIADNVSNTARSTTLTSPDGTASIMTIEHLLSACTGLGIDNLLVETDNIEVPILDGSAKPYIDAICPDGLQSQNAERKYIEISEPLEFIDEQKGSYIKITPAPVQSFHCTIDFNSKVVGVQDAGWKEGEDYATAIGPCRTFVFFHEIEYLFANGLVKGGDVDNAIVIVEHPVQKEQLERMSQLFDVPCLEVKEGYLNNLSLRFPNECARHKLLDIMGDLRLAGGFLKAHIEGYKSGHRINTIVASQIRNQIKSKK